LVDAGSAGGAPPRGVKYGLLLAEAVPEIYRLNAFRVTQLPVNATQREISRQVEKIRMAEKIGVAAEVKGGLMPLATSPDSDALRGAVQRLRDPQRRLIDELFWFWPLEDGVENDPALKALETEGTGAASRLWQAAVDEGGRQGAIALHNLAVLAHTVVLDAELDERDGKLSDARRNALKALWTSAYQHWGELRKDELFADVLRERVLDVDDPRLDDSTVANIRKTLAEALASVSARLAVAQFDAGKKEACRRVFAKLRASGLPQADVTRAVREALGPVRARLKACCTSVEKKPGGAPKEILLAAGRLLEQAQPLLALVDMALPEGDATRAGLHDDVAGLVFSMTIDYGNQSEDFRGALPWLERAATIAEGDAALHRISENTDTARENADAKDAYDRAVRSGGASPQYRQGTVGKVTSAGAGAAVGGLGCLWRTLGLFIVIAIIGGIFSLGGKACGCDNSSTSASNSGSTYSQPSNDSGSDYTAPESSDPVPSVNYNTIAKKIDAMIVYGNRLPKTTGANAKAASRFREYGRSIRKWMLANDENAATKRLCDKAIQLAKAETAFQANPYASSNLRSVNASIRAFNRVWDNWNP
jgi:hypothetical protein